MTLDRRLEAVCALSEVYVAARGCASRVPHYRLGQAFFNLLPDGAAALVRGTPFDPFYRDERIGDCIEHLADRHVDWFPADDLCACDQYGNRCTLHDELNEVMDDLTSEEH